MKKIHKLLYSIFAFIVCREAHAAYTQCTTITSPTSGISLGSYTPSGGTTSCATTSTFYRQPVGYTGYVKYTTCTSCKSGYKQVGEVHSTACPSITLTGCQLCNTSCTNCTSQSWTTTNTKYQTKVVASCDKCSGSCTKSTSYRCADGYYGSPTSTSAGCTDCPTANSLKGTSVAGYNTANTDCFYESGDTVYATEGAWEYTKNCFYSS